MSGDLGRGIRQSGILEQLRSLAQIQRERAVDQVVDPAGGFVPRAAESLISPQVMRWAPADTGRHRAARAGTAVLGAAFANTPPSTGNCIATLTMIPPGGGQVTIGTVQITNGMQTGEVQLEYPIPAGAWVGGTVTTVNGASGVSISLTIKA